MMKTLHGARNQSVDDLHHDQGFSLGVIERYKNLILIVDRYIYIGIYPFFF